MGVIDLDAYGAARREAHKDKPVVKFGGVTFELPVEMPFAVIEAVTSLQGVDDDDEDAGTQTTEALAGIARALFGDKYREFLDAGASMDDVSALLEHISEAYGTDVGESTASES